MNLSQILLKRIESQLDVETGCYDVALSGGVDSVVLLHLLHRLRAQHNTLDIRAIHVDHGLSENAASWRHFCENVCQQWQIPIICESIAIHLKPRQSLESIARDARYSVFAKYVTTGRTLLLGQHLDDQVETFFIRLKRGSGLTGLGAMRRVGQTQQDVCWLRPLLDTTRHEIETYAEQNNLEYVVDESNKDTRFDRNFLRHQVIPELSRRFSGFSACVARSATLLQQQDALLQEYIRSDYASCSDNARLQVSTLKKMSKARQMEVVRYWLSQHRLTMPSKKWLDNLLLQVGQITDDSKFKLTIADIAIRFYRDYLYIVAPRYIDEVYQLDPSKGRIELSDGRVLIQTGGDKSATVGARLSVRFNLPHLRIHPHGKPGSNTVKHWLKDAKIPSWERPYVPLIFVDDELVEIVDVGVSKSFYKSHGKRWIVEE